MTDYFTSKSIYYINSKNRISGTDSNFTFHLDIDVNVDYTHCALISASIPKTFYSVQNGYNSFTVNEDGVSEVITIPPGNYTRNSFAIVVKNKLNELSPSGFIYNVTYENINRSQDTGHYFFTVSGNAGLQPSFEIDNLGEQLGFENGIEYFFVNNSLESVFCTTLNPQNSLIIHSNIIQDKNAHLKSIMTSGSNSYDYIIYENTNLHETSKPIVRSKANNYTFTLTDENGHLLDLNGSNMVFTIMLFKHSEKLYETIKSFQETLWDVLVALEKNFEQQQIKK